MPMFLFQVISFDYKTLSRKKTAQGNIHVLAIICHSSSWTIYKAVCDETAQTTATVIVEKVIANYGFPSVIISDKAPGYTSFLFSIIKKILGVKHRFTATQSKRSNGADERSIRALNKGLRIFSTDGIDDTQIELILPAIQIFLRASVNLETGLSPFEILYAKKMPLPSYVSTEDSASNFCSTNSRNYVKWLKTAMNSINDGIRRNKIESKLTMKKNYDRRYKTKDVDYRVGDTVLLRDNRIKNNSIRFLRRKPYLNDKFTIIEVIEHSGIGPAYKIMNQKTGKMVKNLVNFDRIKRFVMPNAAT